MEEDSVTNTKIAFNTKIACFSMRSLDHCLDSRIKHKTQMVFGFLNYNFAYKEDTCGYLNSIVVSLILFLLTTTTNVVFLASFELRMTR